MDNQEFDEILERRIELIRSVLKSKAKEYAITDRLHNFNRAARMLEIPRQKALAGMMSKHWVSILDILDNFGKGEPPAIGMIEEKIGDAINYLILLEAMLKEDVRKYKEDMFLFEPTRREPWINS